MPKQPDESFIVFHFPLAGTDVSQAYDRQRIGITPVGSVHAYTTPSALNMRAVEQSTNRMRGASRGGLTKYINDRPLQTLWVNQLLNVIVGVGYPPPGGQGMQLSQSGRVVTVVAVSQGYVFVVNPGDTVWSATINMSGEDPPLNVSGLMYSAANIQKLWIVDGVNFVYYDPSTNTVYPWLATAGQLPVDADLNAPRHIVTWRGRTVVSGLILEPQNVFMSRVGDPTNWDYAPQNPSGFDAVALGNSPTLGLIGDVVTCLIPYSDDTLIIGGDHTITILRGDPLAGGQLDLVTKTIGMTWGMPWTQGPDGTIYFFSNRMGIYSFVPGQQPQRISQGIDALIQDVDTGVNIFLLEWDDRFQGFHVFITPLVAPGETFHYFFETRTGAWWQDQFANTLHNPLCCCVVDGNEAGDRAALLGSWDGYVRLLDPTAVDDDGTPIQSNVMIGPMLTSEMDDMLLVNLQAVLAENSGDVNYDVFVGPTAEVALGTTPVRSGVWHSARNLLTPVRRSGHAVFFRISSTVRWAMESIRAKVVTQGKIRRRGL